MMRQPAEAFPPGEFIRDALADRGWTQEDLAEILGRKPSALAELISGKRALTVDWARELAEAFDTSPQVWLNLESVFRLSQGGSSGEGGIRKLARVYELAPIREMKRRGWIGTGRLPDAIEDELRDFFGVESLDTDPDHLAFAARKSTDYEDDVTPAERAWIQQVVRLASGVALPPFSRDALKSAVGELKNSAEYADGVGRAGGILARAGVPVVVVRHLSGTKIDGACVMVDGRPLIGLSLRYGRIDNFWFTLLHEVGHALEGVSSLDRELLGASGNDDNQMGSEVYANDFAANALLEEHALIADLHECSGPVDDQLIRHLSAKYRVHPGIVVGRLQHNGRYGYNQGRKHLVDVRPLAISSMISDGWNQP